MNTTKTGILIPKNIEKALAPEKAGSKLTIPKTWMSEKQIMKMVQKTPDIHVRTRPAKGGGSWDYVSGVYVKKILNFVFGWLWDFEVISENIYGLADGWGQIVVQGKLTVKNSKGEVITKMQYGRAEIKYKKESKIPLDIGNDFKAAATDALKKCASELGIASDIYGKNEFREMQPTTTIREGAISARSEKAIAAPGKVVRIEDMELKECQMCGELISKEVATYSKGVFNMPLCKKDQIDVAQTLNEAKP